MLLNKGRGDSHFRSSVTKTCFYSASHIHTGTATTSDLSHYRDFKSAWINNTDHFTFSKSYLMLSPLVMSQNTATIRTLSFSEGSCTGRNPLTAFWCKPRHCDPSPGLWLLVTPNRLSRGHEWTLLSFIVWFSSFLPNKLHSKCACREVEGLCSYKDYNKYAAVSSLLLPPENWEWDWYEESMIVAAHKTSKLPFNLPPNRHAATDAAFLEQTV